MWRGWVPGWGKASGLEGLSYRGWAANRLIEMWLVGGPPRNNVRGAKNAASEGRPYGEGRKR
jgi:hypothetical protein